MALLGTFVKTARTDGGAILVTGDAGVGETPLVAVVAADARQRGAQVLRAAGTEFEASLSFAGLDQPLHPVLGRLHDVGEADHRTLRVAPGLAEGRASDELAVSNATLRLLTGLADDQPLSCRGRRRELAGPRERCRAGPCRSPGGRDARPL